MLQTVTWTESDEKLTQLTLSGNFGGEEFRHEPVLNSSYSIKAFINKISEAACTFLFYIMQEQNTSTSSTQASILANFIIIFFFFFPNHS